VSTNRIQVALQKVAVLASGRAASESELTYLESLSGENGDWAPLIDLVNFYMESISNENGTAATLKAIAFNGFGLDLNDDSANQIAAQLESGELTWASVFILCIDNTETLGAILENRAQAAMQFVTQLSDSAISQVLV
jgi:hypothetical protein